MEKVRFYWHDQNDNEFLLECTKKPAGWFPTRCEPERPGFWNDKLATIAQRAEMIASLSNPPMRYFKDEEAQLHRDLESAKKMLADFEALYPQIRDARDAARQRVMSIEIEREKFQ